jgi:hypothetical protein
MHLCDRGLGPLAHYFSGVIENMPRAWAKGVTMEPRRVRRSCDQRLDYLTALLEPW